MAKLHEVLAVMNGGKRDRINTEINGIFHGKAQTAKSLLFHGKSEKYDPISENEQGTQATNLPLVNLVDASQRVSDLWIDLADTMATIETGNVKAVAALRDENGKELTPALPTYFLLPFRKLLIDIRTYIKELDTLDPAVKWAWNSQLGSYSSEPSKKERTKKAKARFVLAEPTDKHPAQVQVYDEDKLVGYITEIRYSTAIPAVRKREMLDAINSLIDRVTKAIEEANRVDVVQQKLVGALLSPIFGLMNKPVE
jgi:hypothetical protein